MTQPDCYKCKHRRDLAGDAHSQCDHPEVGSSPNMIDNIIMIMDGRGGRAAQKLCITAEPHGVRSGWFMWPGNFDPIWLRSCNGFTPKE